MRRKLALPNRRFGFAAIALVAAFGVLTIARYIGNGTTQEMDNNPLTLPVDDTVKLGTPSSQEQGERDHLAYELVAADPQRAGTITLVDLYNQRVVTSLPGSRADTNSPITSASITDDGSVIHSGEDRAILYGPGLTRPTTHEVRRLPADGIVTAFAASYLPVPDSPLVWVVRKGAADLVNFTTRSMTRTVELEPTAIPIVATEAGLFLNTFTSEEAADEQEPGEAGSVLLIKPDGSTVALGRGEVLTASSTHAAVLRCADQASEADCILYAVSIDNRVKTEVARPTEGRWRSLRSPPGPTEGVTVWPDVATTGRMLLGLDGGSSVDDISRDSGIEYVVAVDPLRPQDAEILTTLNGCCQQVAWTGDEQGLVTVSYPTGDAAVISIIDLEDDQRPTLHTTTLPKGLVVLAGRWIPPEAEGKG